MQRIDVYDINLNRIGALFTWVSLIWEYGYNTLGTFQLEVQQTEQTASLLKRWQYFKIDTDDKPMISTSVYVRDKKIVVNGFPATCILDRRVSDVVINNKLAEVSMFQLVNDMSPWENLRTGELKGLQPKFTNQVSDKSILEYCEIIGQATDTGFYIRKDGKELLFECYMPELNPNLKFSEQHGNLADIILALSDTKDYNVCVVAGMATETERITVTVGDVDSTGYKRREIYVDARDVQQEESETMEHYVERLRQRGISKLAEMVSVETIEFCIEDDRARLGDLVSVKVPEFGLQLITRIVTEKYKSQGNRTIRTISVGTPLSVLRS